MQVHCELGYQRIVNGRRRAEKYGMDPRRRTRSLFDLVAFGISILGGRGRVRWSDERDCRLGGDGFGEISSVWLVRTKGEQD